MLFITGLHDARQLAGFDPASFMGRRRRIAIDLIDDIDRLGDPALREALFERIVDARGAFKRTYRDRFSDFDELVVEALGAEGAAPRALAVLDAGVSDGATSLPLIARLDALVGKGLRFTATDLDGVYLRLSRGSDRGRRVIVNQRGDVVQIILPPFLFTHRESRFLFPLNRVMRGRAERFAAELVAQWRRGDERVEVRELRLINPELNRMIGVDRRITFKSWDILEPWSGAAADVVRAMNVLNPGYFDLAQLTTVVGHLKAATVDGGILAFGSNEDAGTPVDGVVCRRAGERLEIIAVSGGGFRAPDALAPHLRT